MNVPFILLISNTEKICYGYELVWPGKFILWMFTKAREKYNNFHLPFNHVSCFLNASDKSTLLCSEIGLVTLISIPYLCPLFFFSQMGNPLVWGTYKSEWSPGSAIHTLYQTNKLPHELNSTGSEQFSSRLLHWIRCSSTTWCERETRAFTEDFNDWYDWHWWRWGWREVWLWNGRS